MEVIQQQQRKPESLYGSTGEIQVEDVNMTTRNRSPDCAYYEPCPNTEFEFYGENKSKSRPSTKWWNDNEVKRKRRVAKYKLYAVEGKVKSSLKNRFRSFKITCMKILHS